MVVGKLSLAECLKDELGETMLCLPSLPKGIKDKRKEVKVLHKYSKTKKRVIPKPVREYLRGNKAVKIVFNDGVPIRTQRKAGRLINKFRAFRRSEGLV